MEKILVILESSYIQVGNAYMNLQDEREAKN